ncbi:DUF1801 domain-containing protein [Nanoarchaeota archaeon]
MQNKEVTQYFEKQKSPQKEICKKLRKMLLKTLPNIKEQKKLGVAWYGKYYIVGLKDSVNLGFSVKGLLKKDKDKFKGAGTTMRHLKFRDTKEINEKEMAKLIKLVDKKAKCSSCYK